MLAASQISLASLLLINQIIITESLNILRKQLFLQSS
jgi:hypothetical protein